MKVKANSFEFIFIAGLSAFGGFLLTFLFGLSVFTAVGVSLILLAFFSLFYLLVQMFLAKQEQKAAPAKKISIKKEKTNFVALGEKNDHKISTSSASHIIVNKIPSTKQIFEAPVVEKKNPMEQFKDDPIGELENARDQIIALLDKTRNSYGRIEKIFGERMHKNTRTDIQNFLYLKQLNESLENRLTQVIDVLDQVEKNNTLSLKKSFELVHGPLSLPKDSFSTIKSDNEIPPLPREEWEKAVVSTLKKLSRKKTFHHALNYAIYN